MKLKSLRIQNFRGYKDATVNFGDFNCIVGKNDVGKTTILKAIELLSHDKETVDTDDYHGKVEVSQEETISITADYEIDEERNAKLLPLSDNKIIKFRKTFLKKKKRKTFVWSYYIGLPKNYITDYPATGVFDSDSHIQNTTIFITKQLQDKIIEVENDFVFVPIELLKGGGFNLYDDLLNMRPKYKFLSSDVSLEELQQKLVNKKLSNSIDDLKNAVNSIQIGEYKFDGAEINITNLIKMSIQSPISKDIPLSNKGEGRQLLAKIALYDELVKLDDFSNIILTFDEPESHLHPEEQRKLCNQIKDLANERYQVIITTHSPFLVKELGVDSMIVVGKGTNNQGTIAEEFKQKNICLPYGSLNEVNYWAFNEASAEFHIELFGYIQNKLGHYDSDGTFIEKNVKGMDDWIRTNYPNCPKYDWYNTKNLSIENVQRSLPYCVRNEIDHPGTLDNVTSNNMKFHELEYIKSSIKFLIRIIQDNQTHNWWS